MKVKALLCALCFVAVATVSVGAASRTLSGFLWSDNVGWISMSTSSVGSFFNSDVNFSDTGPSYGVTAQETASSTYNLTGWAWSENVGWLKFGAGVPSSADAPNPGADNIPAQIRGDKILGWARFCGGTVNGDCNSSTRTDGWDGWVKFVNANVNNQTNRVTGYAWGGNTVGWVALDIGLSAIRIPTCQELGNCPNPGPTVFMTTPLNNARVRGNSVTLSAIATDDTSVSGVTFRAARAGSIMLINNEDTSAEPTNLYRVPWNTVNGAYADGVYDLTAEARDGNNNRTVSTTTRVTVDNTPPVRSNGTPTGRLASNTTSATLTFNTNENAVCRYATAIGTSWSSMNNMTSPGPGVLAMTHSRTFNSLTPGSYNFYVKCEDDLGNRNLNDYLVSFEIASQDPPDNAPNVLITAPANNSTITTGTVTVTANATDDIGVTQVHFQIYATSGTAVHSATVMGAGPNYSTQWNVTSLPPGQYRIRATAIDTAGQTKVSPEVLVEKFSDPAPNQIPRATITAPANGSVLNGTNVAFTATATDDVAVMGVEFKLYGNILDDDLTPPYSYVLNTTRYPDGEYELQVEARDIANQKSNPDLDNGMVRVRFDNTPPTRINGAPTGVLAQGTTQTVMSLNTTEPATCRYGSEANAVNSYSAMPSTLQASQDGITHTVTLTGLTSGTNYAFYVKCRDLVGSGNANNDNYIISFRVDRPDTFPDVTITAPANNQTVNGNVQFTANATDDVGVVGVELKVRNATIANGDDTTAPYAATWDTFNGSYPDGLYSLYAVARDAAGNRSTSSAVVVTVDNTAPVRSGASPSGTLSYTARTTNLNLQTNETATCRYSTSAGVAYSSMNQTFDTTGQADHFEPISGLSAGESRTYYVKCTDMFGNTNSDDYPITFSVAERPEDQTCEELGTCPEEEPGSLSCSLSYSSVTNIATWSATCKNSAGATVTCPTGTTFNWDEDNNGQYTSYDFSDTDNPSNNNRFRVTMTSGKPGPYAPRLVSGDMGGTGTDIISTVAPVCSTARYTPPPDISMELAPEISADTYGVYSTSQVLVRTGNNAKVKWAINAGDINRNSCTLLQNEDQVTSFNPANSEQVIEDVDDWSTGDYGLMIQCDRNTGGSAESNTVNLKIISTPIYTEF